MGAIIDTASEPGSYADALRFVPWIEDRDGTCWRNLPSVAFKQSLDPVEGNTNTGPALHTQPTLASGCEARPPAGASVRGTPAHIRARMVGNGENCPVGDCGQPAGTVCTFALCPGKRRAISSFHAGDNARD